MNTPSLVERLLNSIYVDDVTYGANTEDEAYQLFTVSTRIFAEGGFNLRKFVTNSVSLQQKILTKGQNPGLFEPEVPSSNVHVVEENATYTSTLFR